MSPPPSRIAAPAAARNSYSGTPGFARAIIASMARWHSTPALRTQSQLLLAVDHHQLVHEALGEHELGIRQRLAQHVVLVDRQIVVVTRVDLDEPDASALELELLEALDHDLGIFAAAAVAHVGQRIGAFAARRLGNACRPSRRPASARRRAAPPRRTAIACHSQWPVSHCMPPPKLQWLGPPGTITASSLCSRILSRSDAIAARILRPWSNGRRPRRGNMACRTCWRTARSGRGLRAHLVPGADGSSAAASGCSCVGLNRRSLRHPSARKAGCPPRLGFAGGRVQRIVLSPCNCRW